MTTAVALRIPLYPILGDRVVFITLFMVMLPLVLLVRAGPFLAALLLGMLAIGIVFRHRYFAGNAESAVELAMFGLAAVVATVSAWLAQRAEKRRRSADAMLRAFVDESPTCKWITGPDGRIVYANQAMADALGRPANQIIGRTHAELLPAKLAELAVSHIKAVRESGQPRASFEEVEPLGGGARRILDWRRFVLKLGTHDHVLVAGMANDVTDKVRTERALRDSEVRYRSLFDAAVYGVITFDETGPIHSANRAAERLFGYTQAELVGRNVSVLLHESCHGQHAEDLADYLRTSEGKSIGIGREVIGRRKDGSTFQMELAVSDFQLDGKCCFTGFVHDISERKRAQEQLAQNQQLFYELIERCPFGIYIVDSEFKIATMNRGGQDGAFVNVRPVIGRPFNEAMHILWTPEVADEIIRTFRHTLETGEPYHSNDFINPRADRNVVEGYEWELHRVTLPDGTFGVICYYFDSTRLREAERTVRESEARLRTLIEQLPAGVGVMDMTGRWVLTNRTMDFYVPNGIPSTQIDRAKRWRFWDERGELVPPEQWPGQRALRGETVLPGFEVLYTDDDGGEVWMRVSAVPLRSDSGEIAGATCVVMDIDLAKRFRDSLEKELAKRTEEVQQAAKAAMAAQRLAAVGTMASGLAHDMKNVLLPLSARMDAVLAASELQGEAHTDLTVVVALIDHLRQMARNLELFARDPEQEGSEGVTVLASWCRRVQGLFESSLDSSGRRGNGWIRLKCDVPEGLPNVGIAPHRLTQCVLNLVHNARDAILAKSQRQNDQNGQAGTISVEAIATTDGSDVMLKVIDDGLGMDDETKRRCLEPFFTTKDRPGVAGLSGSGLGLALVHAVAERVGGRLQVESEIGKGTAVTMILPAARHERSTAASQPVGQARVSIEDKRIRALVIDTLRSLKYETIDGHPEKDSPSIAWVTDGIGAKPEQAAMFLRLRPGQQVVVIGGDESWRSVGASVCQRSAAGLRTALTEQLSKGEPR